MKIVYQVLAEQNATKDINGDESGKYLIALLINYGIMGKVLIIEAKSGFECIKKQIKKNHIL